MILVDAQEIASLAALDEQARGVAILAIAARVCASPIPYRRPSIQAAMADFQALADFPAASLITADADWKAKHGNPPGPILGTITNCGKGSTASDVWQIEERWRARYIFDPSPNFRWHDHHYMAGLIRRQVEDGSQEITDVDLRSAFLRMGYTPAQFPASAAKAIIDWCQAKVVIDPCAGWGDRLIGAMASGAKVYYGMDTNRGLHWGYRQAIRAYRPGSEHAIRHADCTTEAAWAGLPPADLVLTSPPHAHHEQYQDGRIERGDPAEWARRFLVPMIARAADGLRAGGVMAIHMNDVQVRQDVLPLISILHEAVTSAHRFDYLGCLGILSINRKSEPKGEPVLIWRKHAA
jgi:hypothetical protein